MLWFWSALGASAVWGFVYAACEYTLKNGISPTAQMALFSLSLSPIYTLLALKDGALQNGFRVLRTNPTALKYFLLIITGYAVANFLVYYSIQQKNATLSSLIEISYPLFVAVFAFMIFGQMQLTLGSMIGGGLIIAGVIIMYVMS